MHPGVLVTAFIASPRPASSLDKVAHSARPFRRFPLRGALRVIQSDHTSRLPGHNVPSIIRGPYTNWFVSRLLRTAVKRWCTPDFRGPQIGVQHGPHPGPRLVETGSRCSGLWLVDPLGPSECPERAAGGVECVILGCPRAAYPVFHRETGTPHTTPRGDSRSPRHAGFAFGNP